MKIYHNKIYLFLNISFAMLLGIESLDARAAGVSMRTEILDLKGAPKKYQKIILENSKIQISILPELGGKIYEFISKDSGHNQFYKNTQWRRIKDWGVNPLRKEGNWLPVGGIEFSFPVEEHGSVYDQVVQLKDSTDSEGGKILEFHFQPSSDTKGMTLAVRIALNPDQDYFEIHSKIESLM